MIKKGIFDKHVQKREGAKSLSPSSSRVVEYFDEERVAQREEFLNLERLQEKDKTSSDQKLSKKPRKSAKPKILTFEQKLKLTELWLEETFHHLFVADEYLPLDHFIVRDLKLDYKNNCLKKIYPEELVIKAALSRYRESFGYLSSIQEGAPRHNIKGEVAGIVTKEEEEVAKKILAAI